MKKRDQLALPTRIISYAWGERYVNELLSITLPATLAPGNLPYLASVAPCEFVIVTEEAFFSTVLAAPAVVRIREICPLRLISLDDLITSPDQYGIALTYALHRGFADLGPSVTDAWLIFLNADFVLADGSWRRLFWHLSEGARLVASPSYCVDAKAATPALLRHFDPMTCSINVPSRALAKLILQSQHNTVRGKTVNYSRFSLRYMDQFYWRVDEDTLIGHQMPIAIVGMRPERHLQEPNSFWDFGLIRELCPSAEVCVLGDSDEFLMLELRSSEVARDQIVVGWLPPKKIGETMRLWVTPYQKDFAVYPLTLHAKEIPPDITEHRNKLAAYKDEVLSYAPLTLPSHADHPQWAYHRYRFIQTRHQFLSRRLGSTTEFEQPPPWSSELDKAWWQLDGLQKSYARQGEVLRLNLRSALDAIAEARSAGHSTHRETWQSIVSELASAESPVPPSSSYLNVEFKQMAQGRSESSMTPHAYARGYYSDVLAGLDYRLKYQLKDELAKHWRLEQLELGVTDYFERRLRELDLQFDKARVGLDAEYRSLLPAPLPPTAFDEWAPNSSPQPPVTSAVPRLPIFGSSGQNISVLPSQVAQFIDKNVLGDLPYVSRFHPYGPLIRPLLQIVDGVRKAEPSGALLINAQSGITATLAARVTDKHVRASLADALAGLFSERREGEPQFSLCLCELTPAELPAFNHVVAAITPSMQPDSTIVGWCPLWSVAGAAEAPEALSTFPHGNELSQLKIYCTGSEVAVRAMRLFDRMRSWAQSSLLSRRLASLVLLPVVMWCAFLASRRDAAASQDR